MLNQIKRVIFIMYKKITQIKDVDDDDDLKKKKNKKIIFILKKTLRYIKFNYVK